MIKKNIGWIITIGILLAWGISSQSGMWKIKKEYRSLQKEIEIKEYEIKEYEKNIKTLHNIADSSIVKPHELEQFDSIRANFKRHLEQLRQFKE